MCKKLISLISLVVVLGMAGSASAELILHWSFDEGSGDTAIDQSGNGRDGTIEGDPAWVAGMIGGALDFGGDGDHVVDEDGEDYINGLDAITVSMWIKSDVTNTDKGFLHCMDPAGQDRVVSMRYDSAGASFGGSNLLKMGVQSTGGEQQLESSDNLQVTDWQHVALTWESGGLIRFYVDGVEDATPAGRNGPNNGGTISECTKLIIGLGGKDEGGNAGWDGLVDDVRIYDTALTAEEIQAAMEGEGFPFALGPTPENGALVEQTWATLSWSAGDFAVSHDVYFSDNFDDVNSGAEAAFQGSKPVNDTTLIVGFTGFPVPEGLAPGSTYYWRVDEVNEADPNSPWIGDVWSFSIPPTTAYNPSPADGAQFIPTDVELSWTPGFNAKLHTVFFGDDFDAVANATEGTQQGTATFTPDDLALGKTYYWRVDELDPPATHAGDVWSFTTIPDIPIDNPNLVGWWKFEAGAGTMVIDFSGHGNHGTIAGAANLNWVESLFNLGLEFPGDNEGFIELPTDMVNSETGSVTMWINTNLTSNEGMLFYGTETDGDGFGDQNELHMHVDDPGVLGFGIEGATDVRLDGPQVAGAGWVHVAATWDTTDGCKLYLDGAEVDSMPHNNTIVDFAVIRLGRPVDTGNGNRFFAGIMDDVRLFDVAITADQVNEIMTKGEDPLKAANPSPRSGSLPGVDDVPPLTWSAGEMAAEHDVYFGTDEAAVENADASDTTGVYRGRQSGTSFTPAEPLEWGSGPYFWRIDEINTDGTIKKGTVWSFTISDFTLVDGFETYTDNDAEGEAIWQTWLDGFGVAANGSQTGYTLPPYAEQTIVHSGGQSMPLQYNNTAGVTNSQVERELDSPRDWTRNGVEELSLWFQGRPPSVGSFVEGPVGTFTMTATGADIWNDADQFHYAYRTLTGVGSIEAQVLSVEQTDNWAKAGVMIRETLDPGSKFAAVYMTPTNADGTATNGVRFQARTDTDIDAVSDSSIATPEQMDLVAPQWIKIERDVAGNFRGYYSSDGANWTPMAWNPQSIPMEQTVHIGLALTSHNNDAVCEAQFSSVRTTGTVSPTWTSQDIGIAANDAEPFYVAISNANGQPAVVTNENPDAANAETWTPWVIELQRFADQGINLADVDKIAIGLGATGGASAGGSGIMFIDDIRLYRSGEAPRQ